jgi:hypothetical protein
MELIDSRRFFQLYDKWFGEHGVVPASMYQTSRPAARTAAMSRTTNVIEGLHQEFRRRVTTQGSPPTEDAALVLLFGLLASGQVRLRRVDGWRHIPAVLSQRRRSVA